MVRPTNMGKPVRTEKKTKSIGHMLLSRRNRAVPTQTSTTALMTPAHKAAPIPGRWPAGSIVRANVVAKRTTLVIATLRGEEEKNAGLAPGLYPVHGCCA